MNKIDRLDSRDGHLRLYPYSYPYSYLLLQIVPMRTFKGMIRYDLIPIQTIPWTHSDHTMVEVVQAFYAVNILGTSLYLLILVLEVGTRPHTYTY